MSYQKLIGDVKDALERTVSDLGMPPVGFSVVLAKSGFGDLSSNAPFLLAKKLGKSPYEISKKLSDAYAGHAGVMIARCEPHPSGYLNFFINHARLNGMIIRNSIRDDYGELDIGKDRTVTVEHTSVNPNKAIHMGHVRNIVIGDTIARILRKAGFRVNVLNYVDDSGLQVADIILGFQELGFPQIPPGGGKFDKYCGDEVYVNTTQEYEKNPKLKEKRDRILRELEDGDSETAKFADKITRRVLECQLETCWSLAASYDCINFESQIIRSGLWKKVFAKLQEMKLIEYESEGKNAGCWLVRGEGGSDDKVVVRSNGTATYVAKDIPYAAWKLGLLDDPFGYKRHGREQPGGRALWETVLSHTGKQNFFGERVLTVIDSRQSRLQQIITALMGKFKSDAGAYVHLGYESVTLGPGTAKVLGIETHGKSAQMSGRRGLYVNADSMLDQLRRKIGAETKKRNPGLPDQDADEISHALSVATIRYEMIKQDLDKIISFDVSKSLNLEGDTAPYIQYGYARAARILENAGLGPDFDADFALLENKHERDLIRLVGCFEIQVRDAANNFSPKIIARYSYDLAAAFNGFYEHVRILDSEGELARARICLVRSFMSVLEKSLDLIGITTPARM